MISFRRPWTLRVRLDQIWNLYLFTMGYHVHFIQQLCARIHCVF